MFPRDSWGLLGTRVILGTPQGLPGELFKIYHVSFLGEFLGSSWGVPLFFLKNSKFFNFLAFI